MKIRLSILNLFLGVTLLVSIPFFDSKDNLSSLVKNDYFISTVDTVPEGYLSIDTLSRNTSKIFLNKVEIKKTIESPVRIERDIVSVPNHGLIGGEIIAKNTAINGYIFPFNCRIINVDGDLLTLDLLDSTSVYFSIDIPDIPLNFDELSLSVSVKNERIKILSETHHLNTNGNRYYFLVNFENSGEIHNSDIVKINFLCNSVTSNGLIVNNSFLNRDGENYYLLVSCYLNKKEYCTKRNVSITRNLGAYSIIAGDEIQAGYKIFKY